MRQAEAAEEPPDRNAVDRDAVPVRKLGHQIVERQIALSSAIRASSQARTGSSLPCPPPLPWRRG